MPDEAPDEVPEEDCRLTVCEVLSVSLDVCCSEPQPAKAVIAFTEGVKTVDPMKAVGKLSQLWINFAKFYEKYDDMENAVRVFEKATQVWFKSVEELAAVWSEWVEMLLRHDMLEEAYQTCLQATTQPRQNYSISEE